MSLEYLKKAQSYPHFFNLKQTPDKITYEPYFLFVGRIENKRDYKP